MERALALLGAKFCHDIASPVNALGLILETAQADPSCLSLAHQSQQDLALTLALYRILFSYRNTGALAGSAWHWIQKEAHEHKRRLRLPNIEESIIADWLSKLILGVYAICIRSAKEGGEFGVELSPTQCTLRWDGSTRIPGLEHLLTVSDASLVDSTAALPVFIHALSTANGAVIHAQSTPNLLVTVQWKKPFSI